MQLKPCPTGNSILDIFASLKKLLYGVNSEACNQFSLVKYTHSLPTTAFSLKEMKMWWRYFIHFFVPTLQKRHFGNVRWSASQKKIWWFLKGMLVVSWGEKKIRRFFFLSPYFVSCMHRFPQFSFHFHFFTRTTFWMSIFQNMAWLLPTLGAVERCRMLINLTRNQVHFTLP